MPTIRRALLALLALGILPTAASAAPRVSVLSRGLDQPRHLAFGPGGALWVAEAGHGGRLACHTGAEGPACVGATGAPSGGGTGKRLALPAGTLTHPGGLTVGAGGALYVSDRSATAHQGRILRIRP